jgi:hypothetical protein
MSTTALELSEVQRHERLAALVAADGSPRRAARYLKDRGVPTTEGELRGLREQHSGLYMAIANDQTRAQEEALAQQFRESAKAATRLTTDLMEQVQSEIDDGKLSNETIRMLPQIMQGAAKVAQVSTDKLLAITGRPVSGGPADPMESLRELERMGVIVRKEARRIDAEATVEEA